MTYELRIALLGMALRVMHRREPDLIIGDRYLQRWWLIPRNPVCNVYLHLIRSDDNDRALHTHPWVNCSILLLGSYWEHVQGGTAILRRKGSITFRWPSTAHRLELIDHRRPVISLFLTGPRVREWGFWRGNRFIRHQDYLAEGKNESSA